MRRWSGVGLRVVDVAGHGLVGRPGAPLRFVHRGPRGRHGVRVVFVGKDRVVWKRVLYYVLSFGITRRIWLYRLNKELDGHAALGTNHNLNKVLLILPIIGPFIVQCQTTKRINNDLHTDQPLAYGPTWALCLLGLVPIIGNGFYIGWTQDRMNRYWRFEKDNMEHGIDIDVGLQEDRKFLIELEKARKESYQAGSRFDRKARLREERWRAKVDGLEEIRREREEVRAKGGSTPVLPWKRPTPIPKTVLKITCKCGHAFQRQRDPYHPTEIRCPKCDAVEVLPAEYGGGGVVERVVDVECPQCNAAFRAKGPEDEPLDIVCPDCGLEETLTV